MQPNSKLKLYRKKGITDKQDIFKKMNIWYIISTLFYFGKTPIAPGTMASLITMLIWLLVPLNYFIQII